MGLKLAIHGKNGRLGSCIFQLATKSPFFEVGALTTSDVVIDVTSPCGTQSILSTCIENKIPLVIGTTGHDEKQQDLIKGASCFIPILVACNFAPGILVMQNFLKQLFHQYGKGYVDIIEKHHEKKRDLPSGTALFLKEQILKLSPESIIEIHSIRHPDEVGEHHLIFSFENEKIEMTHRAMSREAFAQGALMAAEFLITKGPGMYYMKDIY